MNPFIFKNKRNYTNLISYILKIGISKSKNLWRHLVKTKQSTQKKIRQVNLLNF